ncbi:hypothetical protein OESDEN_12301, partial [Oesophagostomum dentatum]
LPDILFDYILANLTAHDDPLRLSENIPRNISTHGHWTREEVQIFVLAALLIFIVFGFLMIAAMDCVKQIFCRCLRRKRVSDDWKAPPPSFLAPPPYSSTLSLPTIA